MAEEDRKDRLVEPEGVVEARKYAALAIRLALAATPLTESEVARSMKISTGHLSLKNLSEAPYFLDKAITGFEDLGIRKT